MSAVLVRASLARARLARARLARIGLAVLLCLASGCAGRGSLAPALEVGQQAPHARFTLLSGEPLTLAQVRGKPVVVIFWASTCTVSPKVVERMNAVAAKLGADRATFIAASLDKADVIPEIKEMIRLREMDKLTHALSGNAEYDEAFLALRGRDLPFVMLMDSAGKIAYTGRKVGPVEEYFQTH